MRCATFDIDRGCFNFLASLTLVTALACSFDGDTKLGSRSALSDANISNQESDASATATDAMVQPAEIFAGAEDDLWSIDPTTLEATYVGDFYGTGTGNFSCGGIALDASGTLYAISVGPPSILYQVNKSTAELSIPIPLGNVDATWGSTVVPAGTVASSERLVIAGPGGDLRAIDLTNGNTSNIGTFNDGWRVSGDLAWVDGVGLMGTLDNGGNDMLATISLSDASVTILGDTGRSDVYGLTSVGGRVWGLTGSQDIFEMNPSDASVLSTQSGPSFWSIAAP